VADPSRRGGALDSAFVANRPKRPEKHRVEGGGRTTPKGGGTKARSGKDSPAKDSSSKSSSPKSSKRTTTPEQSTRYTPPVPSYQKVSGPWVPALMFTFWGLGIAMILFNYFQILPGGVSNWYVFGGLGLILAGIVTATQYR
jgi:hypothetical protein